MTKRNANKPTNNEPHAAGCSCGPCYDSRMRERQQPKPKAPADACGVQDGTIGRTCIHPRGHEGLHSTGFRTFRDPKPPAEKPKRAPKAAKSAPSEVDGPKVCGNAARDPSTGKPFKGPAPYARTCEREPGHEGPHRVGPVGDLELVVEWDDSRAGTVSYNRKAQRPEDDDEEFVADEHDRDDLNADVPDESEDDEDPRPQWLREQTAQRDAAGRGTPAHTEPEDEEGDDPLDGEVRSDADRDLAREMREAREKHAAELAAAEEPPALDPAVGRMDGKDCGVIGARSKACTLDQGHDGDHCDSSGRTWADRKPRTAKPPGDLFARASAGVDSSATVDKLLAPTPMIPPTGETITCRGKVYRIHPAARIFPTTEAQYRRLVDSMRATGQIHEVEILTDGRVIDGCSRLRACEELGIDPRASEVFVDNPIAYVVAVNISRRHLSESQRAMVAADLATLEHGANQHDRAAETPTQAEAAAMTGVSERLVRDAVRVKNRSPEVAAAVRAGKLKVSASVELADLPSGKQHELLEKHAKGDGEIRAGKMRALVRQEKKRDIVTQINAGRVEPLPDGPFGVIYGDYPWKFENADQHEGSRGHMGYPPMEMDAILAHGAEVAKRAAKDCVVALWFVNAFMHEIGRVLAAYGATQRTVWTWDKSTVNDKDFAGVGSWGRGRTEHLVIASIGSPVHTFNEIGTLIRAGLREHSRKPDEFASLLLKHAGGPHLELFAREPREGWVVWGAESKGAAAIAPKRSKIYTETDRLAQRAG